MSEDKAWGESVNSGWIDIQKRTFTKWCNSHLVDRMLKIGVLDKDLEDGVMLCALLEQISSKNLGLVNKKAKIRAQKLENNGAALKFLKDEGIKLVAIGPEDIVDGNLKLILGLIWTIILRYQIQKIGVQGGSAKSDLLAWVRKQIPEYNINNFKEDWRDGKALCALGESLKPGIVDLPAMARKSALENARTGSDAAEKELGIPPILQPEDLVSPDVDELSVMTYISYFRDYEANNKKNMEAEALARTVDPLKCIAFGPGLEHAEVGYDAEFTIQARNAAGKNITSGGETFDVQIKAPLNSPPVKAEVSDNGDGTYKVVYNPKAHGQHVISVNIHNKPIQNSPFRVNVDRLGLDPSQTDAFGPGLEGATAKQPTHFTIVAKNKKGDPVGAGGERFDIQIKGPYDSDIKHEVLDNKDGSYTVNYKPTEPGDLKIAINYEGKSVGKSPYHVKCDSHPDASDAGKSEAYGPGLENIIAGEPANFTIQAKNKKGEKLTKGGDAFDVEVIGPDDLPLDVKVVDNKDGTYSVNYNPENPGKHKIDVVLRGDNPLFYDHVKGSPKVLDAEAGTDAAKTLVFGPGVEDGLLDTLPGNFTIQAKDRNGKDLGKGGDPFEVKVTDQNGNQIAAPITDNGDGTYNVQYQPNGPGRHKVDVRLKGKPVGNTPVSVNVKEGASWEHTGIESFSFVIRTKDKKGNNKSQGGELEHFSVTVTKQGGGGDKITPKVHDVGDGTYVVTYSVPGPGEYQIGAMLNGHHIKGSPWKQSA